MQQKLRQITVAGMAMDLPHTAKMIRNWDTGWLRHFRWLMIDTMGKNYPVANGAMIINLIDSELVKRTDKGMSDEEIVQQYHPALYFPFDRMISKGK